MKNIEVEIRSFVTPEKYKELLDFFEKEGKSLGQDRQETHYFDCKNDVRIQKNDKFSKIWMKLGKIHDEAREEVEVKCEKEDFEKLMKIFESLGHEVAIKWFRERNTFEWEGVVVTLDDTKGYGRIIELEKMSDEKSKDETLKFLKEKMSELGVEVSTREEFEERYRHYKENWKSLIR